MENNNWQPCIGQRVVCIKAPGSLTKGNIYKVLSIMKCDKCNTWFIGHTPTDMVVENDVFPCCRRKIKTHSYRYSKSENFLPVRPYSNSVSLELAQEAIKENIEVDVPTKEVVNN